MKEAIEEDPTPQAACHSAEKAPRNDVPQNGAPRNAAGGMRSLLLRGGTAIPVATTIPRLPNEASDAIKQSKFCRGNAASLVAARESVLYVCRCRRLVCLQT